MRHGPWRYSRTFEISDPDQGWKIHLSATVLSALEVFARAWPICRKSGVLFKVPARLEILAALNSGLGEFSQIGKFITVYPRSVNEALDLAHRLHCATRDLPGPSIPFDSHYRKRSLVYYRYAPYRSSSDGIFGFISAPGGRRRRDGRGPGAAVPRWLTDPFRKSRCYALPWRGLARRGLLLLKTKSQRGKGGVYEALDHSVLPAREVIVKEGRRHGETDWNGRDGYARLKHEARILCQLNKSGLPVPRILWEFASEGSRYLVLERIVGRHLISPSRIQPTTASWRRAAKILEQIEPLLFKIHAAGWVWRDCKPSHILFSHGSLWLVDFEGACRTDETAILPWGSTRYLPPSYQGNFFRRPGALEDDFALGVIAFQFMCGAFPPNSARRRAAFYKPAGCPGFLRRRIEGLLQY